MFLGLLRTKLEVWRQKPNFLPTEDLQLKENEIIDIPTRNNERLKIKDEWDTETICHQIKECHPCLIKAKLAGSGKSYMGEYMKNLNHNVLFVCPNNKQIQEVGVDAIRNNLGKKYKYEVGEFLGKMLTWKLQNCKMWRHKKK